MAKSYHLLSAYYGPIPAKHLTLFSTDSSIMRNCFYHFYFTTTGAKAQRGLSHLMSWHISRNQQMDIDETKKLMRVICLTRKNR